MKGRGAIVNIRQLNIVKIKNGHPWAKYNILVAFLDLNNIYLDTKMSFLGEFFKNPIIIPAMLENGDFRENVPKLESLPKKNLKY